VKRKVGNTRFDLKDVFLPPNWLLPTETAAANISEKVCLLTDDLLRDPGTYISVELSFHYTNSFAAFATKNEAKYFSSKKHQIIFFLL
jgi:hypothetical protein